MPAAASQVTHAAERQHLRSVFIRGNVSDGLALRTHYTALRPEVPIRVDLQFHAAVTENPFSHYRDHIHAGDFRRNNEWGRLVIRIGRASADGSYEGLFAAHQRAVPVA